MNKRFTVTENINTVGGSLIHELPGVSHDKILDLFGQVPDDIGDKYSQPLIIHDAESGFLFTLYTRCEEYRIGSRNEKACSDQQYMLVAEQLRAYIMAADEKKEDAANESHHTPGPWTFKKHGNQAITIHTDVNSDNVEIARIDTPEINEADTSNAHLIAAAPELLEALKEIVKANDFPMGPKAKKLRIEIARDIIAKAEGK